MTPTLAAIMDGIAARLISQSVVTRAHAWPIETINPPCGIVGYPTTPIDLDATFGGATEMTFPVWIVVGAGNTRAARDAISAYLTANDVKAALEPTLGGVVGSVDVTQATIETLTVGAVEYLALRFDVDVI